jgi:hypothetical protein
MVRQRLVACLILGAALCLAGCGTRTAWIKPGAGDEDFARDSYECERDARATAGSRGAGLAGGGGLTAAIESGDYQRRCLRQRGWVPGGEAAAERPPVPEALAPDAAPGVPAPNPEM